MSAPTPAASAAAAQSAAPTTASARPPLKRKEHEAADGSDNKEDVSEYHESASSSESVESSAKRAKRTTPPSMSSTSPRSAMLHHLSRDAGSSSALLSCLDFTDLMTLYSTCRTWRQWLLLPSACAPRRVVVRPAQFAQFSLGHLARSKVDSIVINVDDNSENADLSGKKADAIVRGALQLTLLSLGAFSQLRWLRVHLPAYCKVDASIWRACFQTLAPRLHTLQVVVDEDTDDDVSALHSIMPAVGLLTKLERLRVYGPVAAPWHLRFDAFVHLRGLREIEFLDNTCGWGAGRAQQYRATPEQVQCLVACLVNCPHLQVLEFGRWDWNPEGEAVDEETHLARAIGAIVGAIEGRRQGASAAACSFRKLALDDTHISAAVWRWVCRLPSLTELWPLSFAGLSSAEWSHLSRFSSLTALQIHANDSSAIHVADFLPSLLQCSLLQKLSFENLSFTAAQLQSVCASLPRLSSLELFAVSVESLQPLASAPLLSDLTIQLCRLLNGNPLSVRVELPPLLALTRLKFEETRAQLISHSDAAPLDAAVFARCPKLLQDALTQVFPGPRYHSLTPSSLRHRRRNVPADE